MITAKQLAAAIGLFSLVVMGSGLIRFLTTPAGHNGLYFGLVMGGLALLGAVLAGLNLVLAGRFIGGLAVGFVLLWFGYDMYKDLAANFVIGLAEIRKLIVIVAGLATAVIVCLPLRKSV